MVGLRLALVGSMNDEVLNLHELSLELIKYVRDNYEGMINARYGLSEEGSPEDILGAIADARKCIKKGNELDYDKASALILDEFRSGVLGKITLEFPENNV